MNASSDISYRYATSEDSAAVASYICLAGDGLYEFLLDDLIPGFTSTEILKWTVGVLASPLSYKNCFVAVDSGTNQIAGVINLFPADLLHEQNHELINTQRWRFLEPVFNLWDQGSLFVNSLAVGRQWRQCGIGGRLLDHAYERAKSDGYDRVSLHVWSDNLNAISFYEKRGFTILDRVALPAHPQLPDKSGSILMSRKV
ncbi:MAG: GNAT family N-acetyltransferase [Anderseniella sp.]